MIKEIYGKKIGMTQLFNEEGDVIPTTLIEVEPVCILEKVDYAATTKARIGCFKIDDQKAAKVKKPVKGYFDKLGTAAYRLIREVDVTPDADFSFLNTSSAAEEAPQESSQAAPAPEETTAQAPETPEASQEQEAQPESAEQNTQETAEAKDAAESEGNEEAAPPADPRYVGVEMFAQGDTLNAQAVTKGRGFAGGMKRHHWSGQPSSHGSTMHRRIGSIGASAYPSKVIKGLRMPGHMGNVKRTTKNLKVIKIDTDKNLLFIQGSMPGPRGALVKLTKVG